MADKDINIIRDRLKEYKSPMDADKAWSSYEKSQVKKIGLIKLITKIAFIPIILIIGIFTWNTLNDSTPQKSENRTAKTLANASETLTNKSEFNKKREDKLQNIVAENNIISIKEANTNKSNEVDIKRTVILNDGINKLGQIANSNILLPNNRISENSVLISEDKELSANKIIQKREPTEPIKSNKQDPKLITNEAEITTQDTTLFKDNSAHLIDKQFNLDSTGISTSIILQNIDSGWKRHTIALQYNLGISESGELSLVSTSKIRNSGTTGGGWRPHGHQSLVLGYTYKVTKRISVQSSLLVGMGYLNGKQEFTYSGTSSSTAPSSGEELAIRVRQSEYGAEISAIATILQYGKLKTQAGLGLSARTFELNYTAGPNTSITGINDPIGPGESSTFKDQTAATHGILRLKYELPPEGLSLNISGIYQRGGKYDRHSIRSGISYSF
jgi:hypothetical protein